MVVLCADNLAHGIMEGQAEHLDVEVNGVAGEVALGPTPIAVLDDESGIGGQNEAFLTFTHEILVLRWPWC